MHEPATKSYRVPIDADSMRSVRTTIESFASAEGYSEKQVGDISLAVAEALFNAMDHGCCRDDTIHVDVTSHRDRLEIAVEDGAKDAAKRCEELERFLIGGAMGNVPEVDLERGRGLFLMRAKSDEVRVERATEGGVRVILVKLRQ